MMAVLNAPDKTATRVADVRIEHETRAGNDEDLKESTCLYTLNLTLSLTVC